MPGAVRAVGVSNFDPALLREVLGMGVARVTVAVLQSRADPLMSELPEVLRLSPTATSNTNHSARQVGSGSWCRRFPYYGKGNPVRAPRSRGCMTPPSTPGLAACERV